MKTNMFLAAVGASAVPQVISQISDGQIHGTVPEQTVSVFEAMLNARN